MKTITKTYNGNILATLSEVKNNLPSALKRLVTFILENKEESIKYTLSELSKAAEVGEATVVRLAKQLGFEGFQDFKIELAVQIAKHSEKESEGIMDSHIEEEDSPSIVAKKITNAISSVLDENLEFLNEKTLVSTVNALLKANKILVFGMGNSGLAAEYFKNKCSRIGLNVTADVNLHYMYTAAALLKPGDVAIGISQYGAGNEVNKVIQIAKEAGATCVCVTHHPSSNLAKRSDYILYSSNRENFLQGDSIATIVSQLHVCEIIYNMLLQENIQKALKTKQLTVKGLSLVLQDD